MRPALRHLLGALTLAVPTLAQVITPVASYEPAETALTLTPRASDAGLSLAIVQGGSGGAPAATDGNWLLRVTIAGEADRKVEFRHDWSTPAYSLDGQDTLLADIYVASPGALPDIVGIWSSNLSPPDNWQPGTGLPTTTGVWTTVAFDVSTRTQTGLDFISAFVIEDLAGTSGTLYIDNLRLSAPGGAQDVRGVAANGLPTANEVHWRPTPGADGYNVYRAAAPGGPFQQLNPTLVPAPPFSDPLDPNRPALYYQVTAVAGGVESAPSSPVAAAWNGLTDDELLDLMQRQHIRYFWEGGHPVCGLAREGLNTGHSPDTVTTGGTGFGIISICVGVERGWIDRGLAAARIFQICDFLENSATRYHGAWAHHINGVTGATIPFAGAADNGADLVETAFLVQGLLTARQYFDDPNDPLESAVRDRVTTLWEDVEWDWFQRTPGNTFLYWHWSPDFDWQMNLPIRGFNETQIIYLLAAASPTHPAPASLYHTGWAGGSAFINGNFYYGYQQWLGRPLGGPLFFTHYSNLGFDPRYKRDLYANYFQNAQNISRINRAYCIDNPLDFAGYTPLAWGLTASQNPFGYSAHSPTNDNGTITPTAAASAIAYVPGESIATMRHLYDNYGATLWGQYGFRDAFNPGVGWTAGGWLAIDEGPIAPMIENHRTGKPWKWFMSNPEIAPMMTAIGMYYEVDYDQDGDIDVNDFIGLRNCWNGPEITPPPPGCSPVDFDLTDLDNDGDADLLDAAIFQQLFTGA